MQNIQETSYRYDLLQSIEKIDVGNSSRDQKHEGFVTVKSVFFQEPSFGAVRYFMQQLKQCVIKAQKIIKQETQKTILESLGDKFDEVVNKKKEYEKANPSTEKTNNELSANDILELLYEVNIFQEFELHFDKLMLNKIGYMIDDQENIHGINQSFLQSLGIQEKERMILHFLDFFSEYFKIPVLLK